jgi:hypothetical protein
VLYSTDVQAEVRKIGSIAVPHVWVPNPSGPGGSYINRDDYTYTDWIQGINICDEYKIARHITGLEPFSDGYRKLAADVNKSGTITSFDVVELRKLRWGQYKKLPLFSAPWRFIPEYVPQDHQAQFDANPFNMVINGHPAINAPYTEQNWIYGIPAAGLGKSGYDGIKIGDVNDATSCKITGDPVAPDDVLLVPNQTYDVDIKVEGFNQVAAFQMGMFLDQAKLEVLGVSSSLPDFSVVDHVDTTSLLTDNQLNFSWFQANTQPHTFSTNQTLFTIKVKAKQPIAHFGTAFSTDSTKAFVPTSFYSVTGECADSVKLSMDIIPVEQIGGGLEDRSKSPATTHRSAVSSLLFCYPNPAGDRLNVALESSVDEDGLLEIYDAYGKLLSAVKVSVSAGVNDLVLDTAIMGSLPSGVFTVALRTESGLRSGKFTKL